MTSRLITSVDNNFTKGLITEATGLNFPENAATDASNCEFTLIGDVTRRAGFDYEDNFQLNVSNTNNNAISTYKWNNVGGDGQTQIIVVQNGGILSFYTVTQATATHPLSTQLSTSTVDLTQFTAVNGAFDPTVECTYADGNGYLFVFNPNCEPAYLSYNNGLIVGNTINLQIRDFYGLNEPGLAVTTRPATLTTEHNYNLQNQGWTTGNKWSATSQTVLNVQTGTQIFTIQSGLTISNGDQITCQALNQLVDPRSGATIALVNVYMSGTVTAYSGTTLTTNITSAYMTGPTGYYTTGGGNGVFFTPGPGVYESVYWPWSIAQGSQGSVTTWVTQEGNYPSNADVWWYFKDASGTFAPGSTQPSVSLATSNAPQGHFVLQAFNQDRGAAAGLTNVQVVKTSKRPSNGAWFQGRVWYTGVNAAQPAKGDAGYYTWSENIYFSQVNLGNATNFGLCFQTNDPTSENLFALLPTDGGVIQIVGSGQIYKLFPVANGMIVFAANGVWFITGSQGIGFSADDYTITKLSSVESLSRHNFVDVMGLPYFWNEEGIYQVSPQQQGGSLAVEPITVGTILSFYANIPKQSKKFARGIYDPINYVITWIYKSSNETSVTDRYTYDSILNLNTYNKAFYPYTIDTTASSINSLQYVQGPGGSNSPDPVVKYLCSNAARTSVTFAEEKDDVTFTDWNSSGNGVNFVSTFTTGYKLHGKGIMEFQIPYVHVYSRNVGYAAYYIQGIWNYSIPPQGTSVGQFIELNETNTVMTIRRHRVRGLGKVLQLRFTSKDGLPFDIMGWSLFENVTSGV